MAKEGAYGTEDSRCGERRYPQKRTARASSRDALVCPLGGILKQIAAYYLEFVHRKNLKQHELPANFLALAIKRIVSDAASTSKIQASLDVVRFFLPEQSTPPVVSWKLRVNTKANLNSSVFKDIILPSAWIIRDSRRRRSSLMKNCLRIEQYCPWETLVSQWKTTTTCTMPWLV